MPFDNLDVCELDIVPSLGIADLFDKVVIRRRGGYCFELNALFANPVIKGEKKVGIVKEIFDGKVSKETMLFLVFVARKNRTIYMRGIADAYVEMWRDYRGIVKSDLVTHQPIDEVARKMVTEMVANYTGKTVELHDRTDPKMLGCFKLEFDGKMYDARIRTKIKRLRTQFAKNDYESKL